MLILGIDPGTATTGYGCIHVGESSFEFVDWGLIETDKNLSPEVRLAAIYESMGVILEKFQPDILAIEKVFFSNNAKTAIRVGQAQGVILLSAANKNIPVIEYAPGTIKKIVAGDGRAKKLQVQESVRKLLGAKIKENKLKKLTKTHIDNAVDALAIALCHMYQSEMSVTAEEVLITEFRQILIK